MTSCIGSSCLLVLSLLGADQTIDSFDYPDVNAARKTWQAVAEGGDTVMLQVADEGDGSVLELPMPFASQPRLSRVYMDREVALNLAAVGEFHLEVRSTVPAAGGRLSLYFRSGNGWCAAGTALAGDGWRTLEFSKDAFSIEGQPSGWHKVDAIRIAVWREQPRDASLRLRSLEAVEHEVAVILPAAAAGNESRTAVRTAERVREMLAELGVRSDAIAEDALPHGAIGGRPLAILAYNPQLSAESTDALVEFVREGGKLFVCYRLPERLSAALGFADPEYYRPDDPQELAAVHFLAEDIPGLPSRLRQESWNITTAEPADFGARVIARWHDQEGDSTGLPAMLLSDRGALFSHIILPDDRDKKKQMLAAVLGHLDPPLWETMARHALERTGSIGHLSDYGSLLSFVTAADNEDANRLLASAARIRKELQRAQAAGRYAAVVERAGGLRAKLVRAYLLAQPSKVVEGRAFWNHSGTGAYGGDWDRTARELSQAGFNMIMPNMLWGGRAHYPSDVLPRSATYEKYGDQISQCVAAAKEYGLQVHVWKVNWNLSGAPKTFVEKIHREERNQVSASGEPHDWLCPSHPENFQLELDSMLEVVREYAVDGLHFDYIRYPGRDKCYCDGCRKRFEAHRGRPVPAWPQDCYSGELRNEYAAWRCGQITRLVKAVHEKAKQLRPDVEISAAVFGAYPSCKESVAQDWPQWVKAGYLDFVCPMDYTQDDHKFIRLVKSQLELVDGRIPVYPGIGQWRLSDDDTVAQIYHARRLGAAGFTLFNLSEASIGSIVPAVGMGVGRQAAATPHRQ